MDVRGEHAANVAPRLVTEGPCLVNCNGRIPPQVIDDGVEAAVVTSTVVVIPRTDPLRE